MSRRRYVRPNEVKVKDRLPEDGQHVLIRERHRYKTYLSARYDAPNERFVLTDGREDRYWSEKLGGDLMSISLAQVLSWIPLKPPFAPPDTE